MATTRKAPTVKAAPKAAPKQPQDRKPPQKSEENRTATVDGLTVHVQTAALDDLQVVEDLATLDTGNGLVLPRLLRTLLGEDGYTQVKDHIRDPETGRASIQAANDFLMKLFQALNPNS